jgi:hypothetical protein
LHLFIFDLKRHTSRRRASVANAISMHVTAPTIVAVKNINAPMLTHVLQQLEYRIVVCRVAHGAPIENL